MVLDIKVKLQVASLFLYILSFVCMCSDNGNKMKRVCMSE